MKIEHVVFNEEHVILKSFLNSNWYDTATPYQFCVSELKELKNEVRNHRKIYIESNGTKYEISTLADFRSWIEKVFFGGFEKFVFSENE